MTAARTFLTAAIAAIALVAVALAAADDASARGRHGGGGHGVASHRGLHHHHRHHFSLQGLRYHRHQQQRHFFSRYTPCVVWTRQGWTTVCALPR